MANDGYVTVRLTRATYDELKTLQDELLRRGVGNLPKPLVRKAEVTTMSGVVSLALKATRQHLKDHDGETLEHDKGKDETHGK